ncbi:DUF559 domain-containing protein [soil metagenome]
MQVIDGPFRAAEALDAGLLTFRELRRFYRAVFPGVWILRGVELSVVDGCRAAWLWSGRAAVVAGLSASALLGAKWIEPDTPVELIHPNRRPPTGVVVHQGFLSPGETTMVKGLPVTSAARTAFDLGRWLDLAEGVERIDALMNTTDVKVVDIEAVARRHTRAKALVQLGETLALVDGGAESKYESKTRLLLVQNGFPPPQTQIEVFDDNGYFVARIDMGWREYKVGVDFEGAHHWTDPKQRSKDVERYARLPELGWTDVRLTSGILHNNPHQFLRRASDALIARGCPRTW